MNNLNLFDAIKTFKEIFNSRTEFLICFILAFLFTFIYNSNKTLTNIYLISNIFYFIFFFIVSTIICRLPRVITAIRNIYSNLKDNRRIVNSMNDLKPPEIEILSYFFTRGEKTLYTWGSKHPSIIKLRSKKIIYASSSLPLIPGTYNISIAAWHYMEKNRDQFTNERAYVMESPFDDGQ